MSSEKIKQNTFIIKDFKPQNVLLGENNEIFFIDFQYIDYYSTIYYDLAFFIEVMENFLFFYGMKKPFIFNFSRLPKFSNSFLKGYFKYSECDSYLLEIFR